MSKRVKVKVQPGQSVRFPGRCVYSLGPAVAMLPVRRRTGRVTREISVPISAAAWEFVNTLTAAERQVDRVGRVGAGVVGIVAALLGLLLLPVTLPWPMRLALGAALGAILGYALLRIAEQESRKRARPEKLAVLNAVRMEHFSWRATTFLFANESYADQFAALNEPYLMEVDPLA